MDWAPGPDVRVLGVGRDGDRWVISAVGTGSRLLSPNAARCRHVGTADTSVIFKISPCKGSQAVVVKMQVSRWRRCLNRECERETFTDSNLPEIVCPHARRTQRIAELVHLFWPRHWWPVGRTADETSRHASQRRHHSAASETAGRPSPREDACTGGRHRRLELAKGSHLPGLSSLTSSGARSSTCCRIAQPPGQPNGFGSILRSKSSAAIAAACMRRARARVRPRRGKSLTDSISCRTCAKRSRPS